MLNPIFLQSKGTAIESKKKFLILESATRQLLILEMQKNFLNLRFRILALLGGLNRGLKAKQKNWQVPRRFGPKFVGYLKLL